MEIYLVGGAVRDKLLSLDVHERDWVVVGAGAQQMLDLKYQQVGKDFPVFLHPSSHEEYALARTERKSGKGHTAFVCDSSADVTLEQDLLRRDLTINAIAQAADGSLIDPYGGQQDIQQRYLRHVSPAFSEDPLRVLRVARFAARFAHLGFRVAAETQQLMRKMANSGELSELVAERVWRELEKALHSQSPQVFVSVLRDCQALVTVLPELDALFGVPQRVEYHPEVDTGAHVLLVMEQAAKAGLSGPARLACLFHDLGKGVTPKDQWPRHIGHELQSLKLVRKVSKRLRLPKNHSQLAEKVAQFHTHCHRALELKPATLLKLFASLDLFRRPELLKEFTGACEADARGRLGLESEPYPQTDYLLAAFEQCRQVDVAALQASGVTGAELGEKIRLQRQAQLTQWVKLQRAS